MLSTEILDHSLPALVAALTGDLVSPSDPEWDLARRAWNLAADQRPALVALPADAADVLAVMAFARANGLKVAPQGTGHNAAAIASLEDTILVSTQRMRGVEIDVVGQTARVAAGTLWLEVTEASTPHGLYPLSGSSPDVGVVGYTLGGGLSWLARKHGLAANHVTAIELVTPAGEHLRATAVEHPELFWALRGGGGNFGVVTAMEFRLFRHDEVYGGMFLWPYERHAEVLHAWRDWTRTAPDEITTSFRIIHFPPLPELPPFLFGRSVVVIDGAFVGAGGADAIAALRDAASRRWTRGRRPRRRRSAASTWIPRTPSRRCRSRCSSATSTTRRSRRSPPRSARARRSCSASCATSAARSAGCRRARARPAAIHGEYLLFAAGIVMGPEHAAAVAAGLAGVRASLEPYATGRQYLNFVEAPTDAAAFYADEDYARLRAIRAAVDPAGIMVGNHRSRRRRERRTTGVRPFRRAPICHARWSWGLTPLAGG